MKQTGYLLIGIIAGLILFPLAYMLVTGDFPGSRIFYGMQEDSITVDFLLTLVGR